jgi:hypothetical protein
VRCIRVAVVIGTLGALLLIPAAPAHACSCAPVGEPAIDVTATAVEDLGYLVGAGSGEERAWRLEVTDGRLGAATGSTIRISMVVGEQRRGDLFQVNGCGMDDNLVVGASYEVVSVDLEGMITCGSSVVGPRGEGPDRSEGGSDRWVVAAAAAAVIGGLGTGLWWRRQSS